MVVRLGWLGHDLRDVLNLVDELHKRGAVLTLLDPYVTTRGETGRIVITVLARRCIKYRQREGIEDAKEQGVYKRRPVSLDYSKITALHRDGVRPAKIPRTVGCSRAAVYKVLEQATRGTRLRLLTGPRLP